MKPLTSSDIVEKQDGKEIRATSAEASLAPPGTNHPADDAQARPLATSLKARASGGSRTSPRWS